MYMACKERVVAQINLNTTPDFEQHLATLMRLKGLPSKSEAIRMAVAAQAEPPSAPACVATSGN
jgi:hypothetical protein